MSNTPTPADNPPDDETTDSDPELVFGVSDQTLAAEMAKYKKSLEEEFAMAQDADDRAVENVEKYTRDFFKKNLAHAAAQIVWLSSNSTSDSVRASCCKFILTEALADAKSDKTPIEDLINSLTKLPAEVKASI